MQLIKFKAIIFVIAIITVQYNVWAQFDKYFNKKYEKCWSSKKQITLLDTVKSAMKVNKIEEYYHRHNFMQTFGCAYEENDIQRNSIRAVYRGIIQSIRNRHITLRDDLIAMLRANPPRPDNLMREYSIYVNIPTAAGVKPARYEIKILDLVAVPTIESIISVWTRLVTRFAYKEDFNKIQTVSHNESEFVQVMEKAQKILFKVERKKFGSIKKMLKVENVADIYPADIQELYFGDSMNLFDENDLKKSYTGIYLGKGILACDTPKDDLVVCKFGEERLYGVRIDANSFRRTNAIYAELNYQAPEIILQCLFLKFGPKKPQSLPPILGFKK